MIKRCILIICVLFLSGCSQKDMFNFNKEATFRNWEMYNVPDMTFTNYNPHSKATKKDSPLLLQTDDDDTYIMFITGQNETYYEIGHLGKITRVNFADKLSVFTTYQTWAALPETERAVQTEIINKRPDFVKAEMQVAVSPLDNKTPVLIDLFNHKNVLAKAMNGTELLIFDARDVERLMFIAQTWKDKQLTLNNPYKS